jgi:hypothetical protein
MVVRHVPIVDGIARGKYRQLLIPATALPAEAAAMHDRLAELKFSAEAGLIEQAEITAFFVLAFCAQRSPAARSRLSWLDLPLGLRRLRLKDILPSVTVPGMPGSIWQVLGGWLSGQLKLTLSNKYLDASTILSAQSEGHRYVTVDLAAALAGEAVGDARDAFEFCLHDLGHAFAFFNPGYDPGGQVRFFRALQSDLTVLQNYTRDDSLFAQALEYCMADMNSHPAHLKAYTIGKITEMFWRGSRTEAMPVNREHELQALLGKLNCLKD